MGIIALKFGLLSIYSKECLMKKLRILSVIMVSLLTLGLIFVSCDNGITPSSGAVDDPLLLTGTSSGKTVTVKISQTDSSKAVLTPKSGNFYEIRVDNVLVSKGKISINGSTWSFIPSPDSPGPKTSFAASFSNGVIFISNIPGTNISDLTATKGGGTTAVDPDLDTRPNLTGTVTISNTSPVVGATLTATYSGGNGSGTATWKWLRGDTQIGNSNSNTYIVAATDEGKTIKAQVSYANQKGSVTSAATAAVPVDNRPTLTGTVTIDKTSPTVGDTLTATYSDGNGTGTATWQWLRGDVPITGASNQNYTVVTADVNAKLKAQVRFTNQKDSVTSAATSAVPDTRPALTGTVSIDNTSPKVDDTLTATYSGDNGTGTATWQWFRGNEEIPGTDKNTYKVTTTDVGKTLKTQVSYADQSGSVTSGATNIVTGGDNSSSQSFNDVTSFKNWLKTKQTNTPSNPYTVALNLSNLTGLKDVLQSEGYRKYVYLDFSDSTFTSIEDYAFSACYLTGVTIPDSVTTIGEYAFCGIELTSVTIPNNVKTIGKYAFSGTELTSVTIPNSITIIEEGAFCGNQLTSITIPNSITIIEGGAFSGNQLTSVTIGNKVTSIGEYAFAFNKLESVTIPDSVTTISLCAFYNNQLTSVTIGSKVTTIEQLAFGYNKLTSVSIPNSVIHLSGFAENQLTSVTIPDSVKTIGARAFDYNNLTSVTIPNSVTTIYGAAFSNNRLLTSVTIGNGVETIGESAFSGNQLTSVTIPNSVKTIEEGAFADNKLTSVTIGNKVTSIGEYAFASNKLESVTIPNSVKTIGESAFKANQLESVTIGTGVETIGRDAFCMNKLSEVTIPNSVKTIGTYAFSENQLTSIIIPNQVETIEDNAFSHNLLTSVTIGIKVTSIENRAFYDNEKIISVTFKGTITSDDFSGFAFDEYPCIGDLRDAYLIGGIGTYIRPNYYTKTWTKQ